MACLGTGVLLLITELFTDLSFSKAHIKFKHYFEIAYSVLTPAANVQKVK